MRALLSPRLAVLSLACLLAACASTSSNTSNKWRLEFSGGADSDGTIVVQVLNVGSVVAEVPVQIPKGTGENAVARRVSEELKLGLPANSFNVEVDDGEDVLIKKRSGVEDFEVRIPSNTVKGVRINTQRE
ncbi:MAG: hypothetical protein EHM68_18070 [Lysobacterales bacterium]|nr:MAG: hypothetical protein EHM68_18070 [Xanthomonadales bacterium]